MCVSMSVPLLLLGDSNSRALAHASIPDRLAAPLEPHAPAAKSLPFNPRNMALPDALAVLSHKRQRLPCATWTAWPMRAARAVLQATATHSRTPHDTELKASARDAAHEKQ